MAEVIGKGSCLCGEVEYQITGHTGIFQYCHCSRCQKFTGSAYASNLIVRPEHFCWTKGEESVGRFELVEAKHFATSFCKKCGSNLPWLVQSGKSVIIPAGTFDTDLPIKPSQNIFWDFHASWYVDSDELPKHAEFPVKK